MMASNSLRVVRLSVAFFLMSNAMADASPPTLARFIDGDHSLQELIEFPDVDDDIVAVVYCYADVHRRGEIVGNLCSRSENVDLSF